MWRALWGVLDVLFVTEKLSVVGARALPVHQLTDGGSGARCRLFICFHLRTRSLFTDRLYAESDFLVFRTHLDDLEIVLIARLQMHGLAVAIYRFRIVAKAFNPLSNLDKGAKSCD